MKWQGRRSIGILLLVTLVSVESKSVGAMDGSSLDRAIQALLT